MPAAVLEYDPGRDDGESMLIAPLVALGVKLVVVAVAMLAPEDLGQGGRDGGCAR